MLLKITRGLWLYVILLLHLCIRCLFQSGSLSQHVFWTWILPTDLQGKSEEILELIVSRQLGAFVFCSSVISCRFITGFVLSLALDVLWLCDTGKPPKLQRLTCKGTVAWCSLQVLEKSGEHFQTFDAGIIRNRTYTLPVQIYSVEDCGINEAKLANHLLCLLFSIEDCCRLSAIDLSGSKPRF